MRLLTPLSLLAIAACSTEKTDTDVVNQIEAQQLRDNGEGGQIACAKSGVIELKQDCIIERADSPDGLVLTVRHADGAFRRLLVTKDGRGVVAADGAEPATVQVLGADRIEVSVAGERYRLPATVKRGGARP